MDVEDGIRDDLVTGVQTCALPIWRTPKRGAKLMASAPRARNNKGRKGVVIKLRSPHVASSELGIFNCSYLGRWPRLLHFAPLALSVVRSEERRVGKEWGWMWKTAYEMIW